MIDMSGEEADNVYIDVCIAGTRHMPVTSNNIHIHKLGPIMSPAIVIYYYM